MQRSSACTCPGWDRNLIRAMLRFSDQSHVDEQPVILSGILSVPLGPHRERSDMSAAASKKSRRTSRHSWITARVSPWVLRVLIDGRGTGDSLDPNRRARPKVPHTDMCCCCLYAGCLTRSKRRIKQWPLMTTLLLLLSPSIQLMWRPSPPLSKTMRCSCRPLPCPCMRNHQT